ncbi:MAG: hypothetical protein J7539_17400 [Niabella sp.]|nr:hypothetical protein [Niabella sp.]
MGIVMRYSKNLLLLIVAVQILNLGVYGGGGFKLFPSTHSQVSSELNEIDSLLEYVVEWVWLHKDVIKENVPHNNTKSHNTILKTSSISYSVPESFAELIHYPPANRSYPFLWKVQPYYQYLNEINPPPPRRPLFA